MGTHPGTLAPVPQDDEISAFDAATAVRRTEGGGLIADLDPGWDVGGGVLNGGYLLAVAARAAVLESPHPHPVALAASYLRATGAGPATLQVTPGPAGPHPRARARGPVRRGRSVPDGPGDDGALGDGEVDVVRPAAGRSRRSRSASPRRSRPPGRLDMPDVGIRHRVETRLDPATAGWVTGRPSGEPVMRAWVRFADGREPDPLGLITFADALPPDPLGDGAAWAGRPRCSCRCCCAPCRRRGGAWSRRGPARSPTAGSTRTTGSGTPPAGWSRRAASSPGRLGASAGSSTSPVR